MHRSDGTGVQVAFVDEEDVVVGVPAVVLAPGQLQGDDMTRDAQSPLQPLPGSSSGDLLPGRSLGIDKPGQRVAEVMRHRDGYQTRGIPCRLPGGERGAQFVGPAVPDLGGADWTKPHVAASLDSAVVSAAVLAADLDLGADRNDPTVALAFGRIRVGCS